MPPKPPPRTIQPTTFSRLLRRVRLAQKPEPVRLRLTKDPQEAIDQLRLQMGLSNRGSRIEDGVYVAIDTEFTRNAVTEIGISSLDTRDIMDIVPDHRAANWISKVKHQHIVIKRHGMRREAPNHRCLFCKTQLRTPDDTRALVLQQLQQARQMSPSHDRRPVHLVGQSIAGDVGMLERCKMLRLDLSNGPNAEFSFDSVLDTAEIAQAACNNGVLLLSNRLGPLAQTLGVDSAYWLGRGVRGTHNAGNDAAYTMMVMLLFAVRWNDLPRELRKPTPALIPPSQQSLATEQAVKKQQKKLRKQTRMQERHARLKFRKELDREDRVLKSARKTAACENAGLLGKIGRTIKSLIWGSPR